jgi:hypothetical protein
MASVLPAKTVRAVGPSQRIDMFLLCLKSRMSSCFLEQLRLRVVGEKNHINNVSNVLL